jgi:methylated-DNA-[protein]-cysteine S-methyltransferase
MKNYTYLHTPIGLMEISEESGKLIEIEFVKYVQRAEGGSMILQEAKWQLEAYFEGKRKEFNLPLHIEAPDFHKEVYTALLNVPYGTTVTYKELAELAGNPSASRAVGAALANNPFPVIIPCHRVLKSDGSLGSYSGGEGIKSKQWLLDHERGVILL